MSINDVSLNLQSSLKNWGFFDFFLECYHDEDKKNDQNLRKYSNLYPRNSKKQYSRNNLLFSRYLYSFPYCCFHKFCIPTLCATMRQCKIKRIKHLLQSKSYLYPFLVTAIRNIHVEIMPRQIFGGFSGMVCRTRFRV